MATLELPWFRSTNFFPAPRASWKHVRRLCIGTQSSRLSEALLLTSLPARLKGEYPSLQIYAYFRSFNSVVFKANPHVSGVSYVPREIFGDGIPLCEEDTHAIQSKENFFGLSRSTDPKPEIYLTDSERKDCETFLSEKLLPANQKKPLCILHAWKSVGEKVAPVEFWDSIVARWGKSFRFWQVGLENDSAIQGCEYYFLQTRSPSNARKLFALMSYARAFVGIDSSPMHVARAFDVPSLILVDDTSDSQQLKKHYSDSHCQQFRTHTGEEGLGRFFSDQISRLTKTGHTHCQHSPNVP